MIVGALRYRPLAGEPAVPGELLRVVAPNRAEPISEAVLWPNGVGLSPGGLRLYVSDFAREHVRAITASGEDEGIFCEAARTAATPSSRPPTIASCRIPAARCSPARSEVAGLPVGPASI